MYTLVTIFLFDFKLFAIHDDDVFHFTVVYDDRLVYIYIDCVKLSKKKFHGLVAFVFIYVFSSLINISQWFHTKYFIVLVVFYRTYRTPNPNKMV